VLSDISLKRAGFDPQLRTQIAAAWRAEDYHRAGELIPDELLDAFILCGTVDEVAARANAYHEEAGMDVPLLQPVLQEASQVDAVLDAAVLYGSRSAAPATAPAGVTSHPLLAAEGGVGAQISRRVRGAWEVVRRFGPLGLVGFVGGYFYPAPPFQYKYRALGLPLVFLLMGPVMVGGAYYAVTGTFDANLIVVSLPVGLLVTAILHGNEWRDVA